MHGLKAIAGDHWIKAHHFLMFFFMHGAQKALGTAAQAHDSAG